MKKLAFIVGLLAASADGSSFTSLKADQGGSGGDQGTGELL